MTANDATDGIRKFTCSVRLLAECEHVRRDCPDLIVIEVAAAQNGHWDGICDRIPDTGANHLLDLLDLATDVDPSSVAQWRPELCPTAVLAMAYGTRPIQLSTAPQRGRRYVRWQYGKDRRAELFRGNTAGRCLVARAPVTADRCYDESENDKV